MKTENPTWGAPRIHGELLHLGFDISEPTVSRYLKRLGRNCDENKAKRWLAFLNNHREVIAAFDFFTVPTMTFHVLYCFFVIEHSRRRILHFNATAHPTSDWIVQQLREALPLPCRCRYILFDRDAKFGSDVWEFLKASGIKPIRTSVRSPWQNGIRSAGSAAFAARCSITSFLSMSSICEGWGVIIWPIITMTELTSDWKRRRRQTDQLSLARQGRRAS
jgi:hypothetical protein